MAAHFPILNDCPYSGTRQAGRTAKRERGPDGPGVRGGMRGNRAGHNPSLQKKGRADDEDHNTHEQQTRRSAV